MKNKAERLKHTSWSVKRWLCIAVLAINVLVFLSMGVLYNAYTQTYKQKLFDENINNVGSLNAASANAAYIYLKGMGIKAVDLISYIERHELSFEECVQYLDESNINVDRQFQLILCGSYDSAGALSWGDYSGVSVRKVEKDNGELQSLKREISYGSSYDDILRFFRDVDDESFGGLCFTPEFTDPDTKLKCFATYRHTVLKDAEGRRKLYAVLLAVNSLSALNSYKMQMMYEGQSTVLINEQGEYIIKSNDYRNSNFYDYIVNYNGLTPDKKVQIQNKVLDATKAGERTTNLFYKNYKGAECVFSVTLVNSGWYSITCVPVSAFNLASTGVDYSLILLLLFLALFIVDAAAVYFAGKALNDSALAAKRAQEEANLANQAKSRFLSTTSHELRTPLNAIIGFTALSEDSIDDPPILKDYLKKISISSKLLLQLISDILDVSAIESNKLKLNKSEFDMTKLISSLSAVYCGQCSANGIEFNVVLKNMHSELLIGDSVRVNQVLLNFLSNAVKFTPRGGKVTLRAEQIQRGEASVVIRFEIRDTGCGISDELKTRLFNPFERAAGDVARKYSGTGLGLSIAKNIAELMNGRVGVESQEGVGSCFWVEIPFAVPEKSPRRSFSPIENLRVLLAVNNADEREYLGQILAGFGVERSLTDNAGAALTLLREGTDAKKPFDLCMLDWKMSDLCALDAAKEIRREFDSASLRVMILTYALAEVKTQCREAGADFVFGKPVFPSALYNFLEEMTTGQARVLPDIAENHDLSGRRVLLVEDNKMNVEVALLLLKKIGLTVETAENGQRGCEIFESSAPGRFDAILMDIQMPVMNGYQAAVRIRSSSHPQARSIPILAMTADAFAEDVEKARDAGMDEHIAKPIALDSLYSTLEKYMRGVK